MDIPKGQRRTNVTMEDHFRFAALLAAASFMLMMLQTLVSGVLAVLGATLIRIQGVSTLLRIRAGLDRGELPAVEMLEGAQLVIAGGLLLTPGFVTDSVGFLLLVPAVRHAIALYVVERHMVRVAGAGRTVPARLWRAAG